MLSGGYMIWIGRVGTVHRRNGVRLIQACNAQRSFAATARRRNHQDVASRTRNIGIIAHIDAGKTTTTERMLYYSGYTRRIGEVDDGSTVTDFLPAERARGITIQSAAITFHWPPTAENLPNETSTSHTINLIDTPGHADFTFEVLRSLRILDGAVCILDGVAGVEAQTEKVWHQASLYKIPKVIYVNKLDRDGAAFGKAVREVATKLHVWPAVCQIPWFENGKGRFTGIVDVVEARALLWPHDGDGKSMRSFTFDELEQQEPLLSKEARKARVALVELLSEHDDEMVEKYLEYDENHLQIPSSDIWASIKRCLATQSPIVPVFAGASFRNIGVQPLLDAVTTLLPSPLQTPDPEVTAGASSGRLQDLLDGKLVSMTEAPKGKKNKNLSLAKNLEACALAFKVVNDGKRGTLVYVRVYQGNLTKGSMLFNTNLQTSERAPRLLKMYASDSVEVPSIPAGQIGVITGLKTARTGDTLITYTGVNPKNGPPAPARDLQLRPIEVPPPVFFASVEPHSLSEEKSVSNALGILLREDPSLHVSTDEDSGQTLISGMGELHLEIARDRLLQDLKAKATMGKIEIGYRECVNTTGGPNDTIFEREVAGKFGKAGCSASVEPSEGEIPQSHRDTLASTIYRDGNIVSIEIVPTDSSQESLNLPSDLTPEQLHFSLQNGALSALGRGPGHRYPMHSTRVSLRFSIKDHLFGVDSTPAALSSAARLATMAALRASADASPTSLMEPVMNVTIAVDEASLGTVAHDISAARGGQILSLDDADAASPSEVGTGSTAASVEVEDAPIIPLSKVYAPPDPFDNPSIEGAGQVGLQGSNRPRTVHARVPLREMVGYLKVLRSQTGGRGSFVMSVDKFEKMSSQREKVVLKELRGI